MSLYFLLLRPLLNSGLVSISSLFSFFLFLSSAMCFVPVSLRRNVHGNKSAHFLVQTTLLLFTFLVPRNLGRTVRLCSKLRAIAPISHVM